MMFSHILTFYIGQERFAYILEVKYCIYIRYYIAQHSAADYLESVITQHKGVRDYKDTKIYLHLLVRKIFNENFVVYNFVVNSLYNCYTTKCKAH